MLPVTMDVSQKKVLPKGALAIILHTCEFAEGNTWGKRITKQAIKVLGAQDEVGVLAYDYQDGEEVGLQADARRRVREAGAADQRRRDRRHAELRRRRCRWADGLARRATRRRST